MLFVISGCGSTHNDAARTQTEGAAAGAVVGGAVGAGVGAAVGKDKKKAAMIGAATGALAGAGAGGAYGSGVAKKKANYAATESTLDSRIEQARADVKTRHAYNTELQKSIAANERQLASIKAGVDRSATKAQRRELKRAVARQKRTIDREQRSWQKTIDAHKVALARDSADPRAQDLNKAIKSLRVEQSVLRKAVAMRARRNSIGARASAR